MIQGTLTTFNKDVKMDPIRVQGVKEGKRRVTSIMTVPRKAGKGRMRRRTGKSTAS